MLATMLLSDVSDATVFANAALMTGPTVLADRLKRQSDNCQCQDIGFGRISANLRIRKVALVFGRRSAPTICVEYMHAVSLPSPAKPIAAYF